MTPEGSDAFEVLVDTSVSVSGRFGGKFFQVAEQAVAIAHRQRFLEADDELTIYFQEGLLAVRVGPENDAKHFFDIPDHQ